MSADPDIARAVLAALAGDRAALDEARMLVGEGYSADGLHEGTCLLTRAVEADDLEIAEFLLRAGAEFSTTNQSLQDSGDSHQWTASAATACHSETMAALLGRYDPPFEHFDDDLFPHATGAALIPDPGVTSAIFNRDALPRFGTANPELCKNPFYLGQIRTGRTGFGAERHYLGEVGHRTCASPVWSFQRFGRTITRLPDGHLVLIAGEHEDYYDDDFNIYNDVTVLDGTGGVQHFLYPRDVFPPTDFHTATLLDDSILLIGNLSYKDQRQKGVTQVLRLSLDDFSMHRVKTSGPPPGWINRHSADLQDGHILIFGGKLEPGYIDNPHRHALDTATMRWQRLG